MSEIDTPFGEHVAKSYSAGDGGYRAEQYKFKFANGFGASVIRGQHTYGGPDGLWELAVIDSAARLTYDTPITNDVLGHQSEADIADALDRIAALPSEVSA